MEVCNIRIENIQDKTFIILPASSAANFWSCKEYEGLLGVERYLTKLQERAIAAAARALKPKKPASETTSKDKDENTIQDVAANDAHGP